MEIILEAPISCSLRDNLRGCVEVFQKAKKEYDRNNSVKFDFRQTKIFTQPFASILIAIIKDRNFSNGQTTKFIAPIDPACNRILKNINLIKRVAKSSNEYEVDTTKIKRLSNTLVVSELAGEVVDTVNAFLNDSEKIHKTLYGVLIELMANTTNHASGEEDGEFPWWLFVFPITKNNSRVVKVVFLDLGVGILKSKSVLSFIENVNQVRGLTTRPTMLNLIFRALFQGGIKPATTNSVRGLGMQLVFQAIQESNFLSMDLIANDVFVTLGENPPTIEIQENDFFGTLLHFEISNDD